jgi:UDP-glucose 4-epimerase
MAKVLITGGAGYIGAHIAHDLADAGFEVRILDDFSNGLERRVTRFKDIHRANILDREAVVNAVKGVDSVIHLAAKKAVGESVENPLKYYENNVGGTLNLLAAMSLCGVKKIVFSSTAAVYAPSEKDAIGENDPTAPLSPYGATKLLSEELISTIGKAEGWSSISLRYFNVAGSGADELGDNSRDNLVPKVFQALESGHSPEIYGDDYPTPDGTCIRDYIHVSDLSNSHIAALQAIQNRHMAEIYNVGSGVGYSVREVIDQVEKTIGRSTGAKVVARRAGDSPKLISSIARISRDLGWKPQLSLKEMVDSAWQSWNSKE